MMAMQYSVRLPDGFDATKVRERVAERSALFDGLVGLEHKSFLFDSRDRVYAPLYVWRDSDAALRFMLDEKMFESVVATFGRPRVRRWMVLDFGHGDRAALPRFARIETDKVNSGSSLRSLAEREGEGHRSMLSRKGLFAHMVALDADRWELTRFGLWRDQASAGKSDADCVQEFQVLHVSEPTGD
jgi:hypothetical protein